VEQYKIVNDPKKRTVLHFLSLGSPAGRGHVDPTCSACAYG